MDEHILKIYKETAEGYTQARYSLWSALFTINGLIITSLAILISRFSEQSFIFPMIIFTISFFSIILIITNYMTMISTHRDAFRELKQFSEHGKSNYDEEHQKAEIRGNRIFIFQNIAIALLFIKILLLGIYVWNAVGVCKPKI